MPKSANNKCSIIWAKYIALISRQKSWAKKRVQFTFKFFSSNCIDIGENYKSLFSNFSFQKLGTKILSWVMLCIQGKGSQNPSKTHIIWVGWILIFIIISFAIFYSHGVHPCEYSGGILWTLPLYTQTNCFIFHPTLP